ncbi:GGDEF domain-containing response regulator [Aestuariirhabdus litorea]|uniref:Response regulator n=1 Tax=Aestuariirhabdus litorea TaxID=2528527 RepID=A0A3P3VLU5_9GAMM|nr:response regulator [Aestuariirhabdus litorea]RRJ83307.1 response regulator [Aestuariirhabdus litorea]RWW93467.1 response regulator [Endozoicomonadaceae bacterium GTF-13]
MIDPNCSIMVVDDARFSSAMIGRTLERTGFKNIRYATSALQALDELERRPASILIADWLMPEMDGLELTSRVRQLDEASNHFTYVLLLTAKEGADALEEAFDRQVDDFIHKSAMNEQLPPRIFAAQRMSSIQNKLLRQNQLLLENNQQLRSRNLVDALTGLGNGRYMLKKLKQSIKQVHERDQAVCVLVIEIKEPDRIANKYNKAILDEVIRGVGRRLSQLVRPMDTVSRLQPTQFAAITTLPNLHHCSSGSFKRIHEGINLKAFKTSAGFISVQATTLLCGVDARQGTIDAKEMLLWLQEQSGCLVDNNRILECEFRPGRAS